MATFRSTAASILSAAALAALMTITSAVAQPLGSGWGPGMMMGPGMMNWHIMGRGICDPRAAGLAEWRLETIERAVQPTEAQRLAITELKTASAKAPQIITAACPRALPRSSAARLTVRPAFDTLYASLSDEQKARLDSAAPRNWGWRRWLWPWNQS